jgi:hypothetical protein
MGLGQNGNGNGNGNVNVYGPLPVYQAAPGGPGFPAGRSSRPIQAVN